MTPKQFSQKLLSWFDKHGRKDLPWQQAINPYRVWLSEIMLQQTQVATVIPYFQRFIEHYPTIQKLANASEDAVMHLWAGLGYYTRARNLHRTAKIICDTYAGKFPDNLDELQKLPGIGRSTAGAILAIAFQQRTAILDGNVKRVLCRFHGITQWPGEKSVENKLWEFAEQYTPASRSADYTQAIMDLGATLCTRSKPSCTICPFQKDCRAYAEDITAQLPARKAAKSIPVRQATFLLLVNQQGKILLEKRANAGIWGGLWSVPQLPGAPTDKAVEKLCREQFQCHILKTRTWPDFRHTFSHFHLDIKPLLLTVKSTAHKIMEANQTLWYNLNEPQAVGLPAPIKFLLDKLSEQS